ncbi:MAG: hypothetical protein GX122_02875 [Candidatus Cloacimonetes bacterium]|nr:hypothetical protein [Candidatus Cloacimonadota bacterium]
MKATYDLETEYKFFQEHLPEFVKEYLGKYLVIIGQSVLGFYNSISEALAEAVKEHEPGSFFIELCTDNKDYYNVVLYNWSVA